MILRKSLTVLKTTYTRWLFGSRLFIFAFSYMFMHVYFIEPQLELSRYFDTPLNAFEPFVGLMNNGIFLPLVAMTYLILISDQPRLDDSATFILFRTGRIPWLLGQLWFLLCSALTFIGFLLVSSMLAVSGRSFIINAWSLVAKKSLISEYRSIFVGKLEAMPDGSVINQSRPFEALIHGVLLMLMYMLIVGIILMLFSLKQKKILGIFVNLSFSAVGLVLWALNNFAKWLFPISNAAYSRHYDALFDETFVGIWYSYVYFIVLSAILIFIAARIGRKTSFHITGGTE